MRLHILFLLLTAVWLTVPVGVQADDVGVSVGIVQEFDVPPTPGSSGGGGAGFTATTAPNQSELASVVLRGWAYPSAFITVFVNGAVTRTIMADVAGRFEVSLNALQAGTTTFQLAAADRTGRPSPSISLIVALMAQTTTTIDRLFIPPTVSIDERSSINQVVLRGETYPLGGVELFVLPERRRYDLLPNPAGRWEFRLPLSELSLGIHEVQVRGKVVGVEHSQPSVVAFEITEKDSVKTIEVIELPVPSLPVVTDPTLIDPSVPPGGVGPIVPPGLPEPTTPGGVVVAPDDAPPVSGDGNVAELGAALRSARSWLFVILIGSLLAASLALWLTVRVLMRLFRKKSRSEN